MKIKTVSLLKILAICSLMLLAFSYGQLVGAKNGGTIQSNVLQPRNAARSAKVAHAEAVEKASDKNPGEALSNGSDVSADGGIMGNEGWYISDVNVVSYKPQNSTISAGNNLTVTKLTEDGIHKVPVYDNFGNKAIRIIQIDQTGPEISWVDMQNGQVASGKMFNIWGDTQDTVSLTAEVDISYDNGKTWETLALPPIPWLKHVADCGWTFLWDTTKVPNGNYVVLARSRDVAGNWSKTISLDLNVQN